MAQHKKDYKPEDILFPNQAIVTSELVGEMKTSYMEYAMSVIVGPGSARRTGRPEAGTSPDSVRHV